MKMAFQANAFKSWDKRARTLAGPYTSGTYKGRAFAIPQYGGQPTAKPQYVTTITKQP